MSRWSVLSLCLLLASLPSCTDGRSTPHDAAAAAPATGTADPSAPADLSDPAVPSDQPPASPPPVSALLPPPPAPVPPMTPPASPPPGLPPTLTPPTATTPLTYTYTITDIPAPGITPQRLLSLNAQSNGGVLAGFFAMDKGYGARVATDQTLSPVLCPATVFQRYQFAANAGPQVTGMNNDRVVVGSDEGVSMQFGMTQTPDGTCTFFLVPGSVGTWASAISDQQVVVGFYWNDPTLPTEPGLLRFHGYLKDAGGIVRLDGPGPHDVVFPTGINALGQIVGYLYSDIQPDNSYVYKAFVYDNGTYQLIDDPSGADVWLVGINNLGQVVGVVGTDGVSGGQAFVLDHGVFHMLNLPTPATSFVQPTAINDLGHLVGSYEERDATHRIAFHQFVATPAPGSLAALVPAQPRTQAAQALTASKRRSIQRTGETPPSLQWTPEIAADGVIVVRSGTQVLGRIPGKGKD